VATVDDVRRLALALPATTEKPSYGTPGFRVKDKLFARIWDGSQRPGGDGGDHDDDEGDVLVVFVSDLGEKEALLATAPDRYFTTSHYDGHAMVLVRLVAVDLDELDDLLAGSWRARAPARLVAAFDAAQA
jgi:hypothetical protein